MHALRAGPIAEGSGSTEIIIYLQTDSNVLGAEDSQVMANSILKIKTTTK